MTAKLFLGVSVAVLVALGAGWVWGSAGRANAEHTLQIVELRSDLHQARGSALAARVDIYNINFGEARRHLEDAKESLRRGSGRLEAAERTSDAPQMDAALAQLESAQQMAGRQDQGANALAAAAAQTIDGVLAATVASK